MLFGEPALPRPEPPRPDDRLPDWQVLDLRKSLDMLGLVSMPERQSVIEELTGRPVASLRDLTFAEARRVTEAFAARRTNATPSGSAWDDRDEDTWIDRL